MEQNQSQETERDAEKLRIQNERFRESVGFSLTQDEKKREEREEVKKREMRKWMEEKEEETKYVEKTSAKGQLIN